jgi:hypothetical protein
MIIEGHEVEWVFSPWQRRIGLASAVEAFYKNQFTLHTGAP